MSGPLRILEERAQVYASKWNLELEACLGYGKDGTVFSTTAGTAVKAFEGVSRYENERECYQRLFDSETREILGHFVPKMLRADDDLLIIEMTMVTPPFLLDFATAYLDREPDFTEDALEIWEREKLEEFGKHWGRVEMLIQMLWDRCGIYMVDVHPGNIAFEDV